MSMVDMKTQLNISGNDNNVIKDAIVIEGFSNKYIKVELKDREINHVFELRWDGYMYSGTFLDYSISCQYNVKDDFSSKKQDAQKPEQFVKRKSGYPKH